MKKLIVGVLAALLVSMATAGVATGPYNSRSGSMPVAVQEVVAPTSDTLTKTQVTGTIITNYGQGAAFNTQTLPAAVEGLCFDAVIGTAQAGSVFALQAGSSDKIYLDGAAGDDNGFVSVIPSPIGLTIRLFTFQTGGSSYDWVATTGSGTWTAGGELVLAYEDGDTIITEDGDNLAVE